MISDNTLIAKAKAVVKQRKSAAAMASMISAGESKINK